MIKVAVYCRVSTDKEDQANSFESQKRYFREYIEQRPDWELYDIYADEGITGTSTKHRTQFNRMICDAYEGKYRKIITKEVSRFSRNILDTIAYTRELKSIGIGVIFASDRIDTLEPESEMLLSYLASMAQEESRRTSSRVIWGQTRQMERGIVFGHSLLGYDVKDGMISVNQSGAETVRLIFHKYTAEQISTTEIARYLTENGYATPGNSPHWTSNSVIKILKNEKYTGDLVQRKTFTPDYLTHKKQANSGQMPYITIRNHHEPIVSRQIWTLAQSRLRQNSKHSCSCEGHSNRYVFSGKIRCAECGSTFVVRYKYLKNGTKLRRWSCGNAVRGGTAACSIGKLIRDDDAMYMLKTAIQSLPLDVSHILNDVTERAFQSIIHSSRNTLIDHRQLAGKITRIRRKKEAVMDSCFSGEISKPDMISMNQKYDRELEELLRLQAESVRQPEFSTPDTVRQEIYALLKLILNGDAVSEVFYKTMVQSLTVFKDRHTELRLKHLPHIFHFSQA